MNKKILVIEDEIHIQRLLEMILSRAGFDVVQAHNGEEGLKLVSAMPAPDVVLLDIMMPGIDGLQVLKAIRENSQTKNIPVLMLTALAQENVVLQGVKLGAKDYIRKPFHPQELVERINRTLADSGAKKVS